MRHVIRKQVIDIQTGSTGGTYHLQQEISRYYHKSILPALEKIFDELSEEDQVITIDRIEIDICLIRKPESNEFISEEELHTLLQQQLEEYLRETKGNDPEKYFSQNKQNVLLKKTPAVHAFEQWLYYMQNGVFPWNTYDTKEIIQRSVLESLSTNLYAVDRLVEKMRNHPVLSLRIVRLHEEKFMMNLIAALTAQKQDMLPELIGCLKDFFPYSDHRQISEELWLHVLVSISENSNQKDATKLMLQAFEKMVAPENLASEKLLAMIEQIPALQAVMPPTLQQAIHHSKTKDPADKKKNTFLSDEEIKNKAALTTTKNEALTSQKNKEQTDRKAKRNKRMHTIQNETDMSSINKEKTAKEDKITSEQEDQENTIRTELQKPAKNTGSVSETDFRQDSNELLEEGFFLQNAGLILLHPFFQFLLRNTGLSKGGVFIDRIAQQKAIYLLHYIVSGETKADEHLLAMPKLICGWPITEPITTDAGLTESMLTEADDLIRAAIAQWTILKNTSVEGLRESFLQREGKIFTKAEKLYIQIEKKSIDLLLDHLPWNISIVKFPWLKDIMWVEWR